MDHSSVFNGLSPSLGPKGKPNRTPIRQIMLRDEVFGDQAISMIHVHTLENRLNNFVSPVN
jgi:hypothetical protein